jgi:hypothetical protein
MKEWQFLRAEFTYGNTIHRKKAAIMHKPAGIRAHDFRIRVV